MNLLKIFVQCRVNFPRAMVVLRAAHLNQQVVFTGGFDDERNMRDEVLCGILWLMMRCFACLRVLQYNPSTKAWSEIGSLKKKRVVHALTEVYLDDAGCVGNLNPGNHHHHHHHPHHYYHLTLRLRHSARWGDDADWLSKWVSNSRSSRASGDANKHWHCLWCDNLMLSVVSLAFWFYETSIMACRYI